MLPALFSTLVMSQAVANLSTNDDQKYGTAFNMSILFLSRCLWSKLVIAPAYPNVMK